MRFVVHENNSNYEVSTLIWHTNWHDLMQSKIFGAHVIYGSKIYKKNVFKLASEGMIPPALRPVKEKKTVNYWTVRDKQVSQTDYEYKTKISDVVNILSSP